MQQSFFVIYLPVGDTITRMVHNVNMILICEG